MASSNQSTLNKMCSPFQSSSKHLPSPLPTSVSQPNRRTPRAFSADRASRGFHAPAHPLEHSCFSSPAIPCFRCSVLPEAFLAHMKGFPSLSDTTTKILLMY